MKIKSITSKPKEETQKKSLQTKLEEKMQLDQQILDLVKKYGKPKWKKIACELNQPEKVSYIRDRYFNNILGSQKTRPFTNEENNIMIDFIENHGTKWKILVKIVPDCTQRQLKNYFHSTLKRRYFLDNPDNYTRYPKVIDLIIKSSYGLSTTELKNLQVLQKKIQDMKNSSKSKTKDKKKYHSISNDLATTLKIRSNIISFKQNQDINEKAQNTIEEASLSKKKIKTEIDVNSLNAFSNEQKQCSIRNKDNTLDQTSSENIVICSLNSDQREQNYPFKPFENIKQSNQRLENQPQCIEENIKVFPNFPLNYMRETPYSGYLYPKKVIFQLCNQRCQQECLLLSQLNQFCRCNAQNYLLNQNPFYMVNPNLMYYTPDPNLKNMLFQQTFYPNLQCYFWQLQNSTNLSQRQLEQFIQYSDTCTKEQIMVKKE